LQPKTRVTMICSKAKKQNNGRRGKKKKESNKSRGKELLGTAAPRKDLVF